MKIVEGQLELVFGHPWWLVEKWDESPSFVRGLRLVQGELDDRTESSKAADVVASRDRRLTIVEIKDFRSRPGAPRSEAFEKRYKELPLEVALKTRDTVAGLVGVACIGTPDALARAIREALFQSVRVVACFATNQHRPGEPSTKRSARIAELRKRIQQKLGWLTHDVHVVDPLLDDLTRALPDVHARSLPFS